ncbi:MAG: trypsin-like peptidase domain-containing protein [Kiritimatiellae bacterium]|nr:trypsin-like peptidase domain-containing protein [Kiritimatiellia bacterium]
MKVVDHIIVLSMVLIASACIASSDAKPDMIDFASGTGVLIDKSYVLTASHVIDDADEILVEFSDGVPMKATVYRKNTEEDWAVLKLDAECATQPISYSPEMQLGDKIYTLGFPSASLLGKNIKYTDGSVSALTGMMDDAKTFQISAPIQPGNSGGPIFDDEGRVVGIVLSCLDPGKFFQHTGGALPQAVNFGLKIQNVIAQATDISFTKGEERTVSENHKATCYIRTKQKISLDRPSLYRQSEKQASNAEKNRRDGSDNSVFDYSKVSQRYRQLAQYLENIANSHFTTLDGDALDASSEDGIVALEAEVEKANKYLIIEGLSIFLYKTTELTKATIDGQTLALYSKARDSLWELKKKTGLVNHKWEEQTFWGLRLGSKIQIVVDKSNYYGYELSIDGNHSNLEFKRADGRDIINAGNLAERERRLANHEEWPVLIFPCERKRSFRGSDDFCLITSLDGVLVGIHWQGSRFGNDPKSKELVELFESKYKIHFKRKLPKEFSNGCGWTGFFKGEYGFLTFKDGGSKDKTPYAYEDKDIRIYIRSVVNKNDYEEVVVFLNNFDEIIKQGKLKVEMENLSNPANIPGSDSL